MGRQDGESETLIPVRTHGGVFDVAHALKAGGFDGSEDGTGRGVPLVPVAFAIQERAVSENPDAGPQGAGVQADLAYTIEARNKVQAVAFTTCQEPKSSPDVAFTLVQPSATGGGQPQAVAYGFEERSRGDDGRGYDRAPHFSEGLAPTIGTVKPPAVAYDLRGREGGAQFEGPHHTANLRAADGGSSRSYVAEPWAVRRLTPVECERLQGFPDGWTDIPRANGKPAADGPRYKALGNSMAVNVMRWIGLRIALTDEVFGEAPPSGMERSPDRMAQHKPSGDAP